MVVNETIKEIIFQFQFPKAGNDFALIEDSILSSHEIYLLSWNTFMT